MTLIVEDGTDVIGADTYVSVDDHIAYAALYGFTIDPSTAEINLRKSMDYIEAQRYKGVREFDTDNNSLKFSRKNIYIDGKVITYQQSLVMIARAENEYALGIFQGADSLSMKGGKVVSSETFGPMTKSYSVAASTPIVNPRVDLFLNPLLLNEKSPLSFRVVTDREKRLHNDCNGLPGCLGEGYITYE